jgi:hypothetical protein
VRRTIAISLLACATVLSAAACSSSTDTSTGGTTSTSKGANGGKTSTTKAALDPTGPKCDAVNKFLIAVVQAVKPENQGKDKGAATVTSLDTSAKALKNAFPAKEAPDSRLRNDADAMLKYLKPLATNPTPPPPEADKTSFDKAKDDMSTFKGMNCKKEGDDAGGEATTTTKKP